MTELGAQLYKVSTLTLLSISLLALSCGRVALAEAQEEFGPLKPKVIKTPFSTAEAETKPTAGVDDLTSIGLTSNQSDQPLVRRQLGDRLTQSRLYLPEKMVLGRVTEFTVKAKPGKWVALAMADKDSGSKPVSGHKLRLGPDRKVVGIQKIPESGVATILVECPIEGDLVGAHLYFEAAIWSNDTMQDVEIAPCVSTDAANRSSNGVLIAPQFEQKKGVRIIPTTTGPFLQQGQQQGLSSPHP